MKVDNVLMDHGVGVSTKKMDPILQDSIPLLKTSPYISNGRDFDVTAFDGDVIYAGGTSNGNLWFLSVNDTESFPKYRTMSTPKSIIPYDGYIFVNAYRITETATSKIYKLRMNYPIIDTIGESGGAMVGDAPMCIDSGYIYIVSHNKRLVSKIDCNTLTEVASSEVGKTFTSYGGICVDEQYVYVTGNAISITGVSSTRLFKFDKTDLSLIGYSGGSTTYAHLTIDGDYIYGHYGSIVEKINKHTLTVAGSISKSPLHNGVTIYGDYIYISDQPHTKKYLKSTFEQTSASGPYFLRTRAFSPVVNGYFSCTYHSGSDNQRDMMGLMLAL